MKKLNILIKDVQNLFAVTLVVSLIFASSACKTETNSETKYSVSILSTENGNVTVNTSDATAGNTITLTVLPEKHYELNALNVTDASGNNILITEEIVGSKYTFIMPSSNVTISATFVVPGFIKVKGTTFDGTKTLAPESTVFISGQKITISDLYVCDHEVTQKEYETYCKYDDGSGVNSIYGKGDNYPAYSVNWYTAIVYCNLRSIAENFSPAYSISGETDPSKWADIVKKTENGITKYCGPSSTNTTWDKLTYNIEADGYRLPTETEWEYIARGGSEWKPYTYSGSDDIEAVAWYQTNSDQKPHEVKTKQANSLGIYDMSGNVSEWCYDWKSDAETKVHRGGSAILPEFYATINLSMETTPSNIDMSCGFRVVRNSN